MQQINYCQKIFQKDIYSIDENDLKSFFSTPQLETSILEFKSGDVEINKLYNEVCAFLNTEGGIIIVGAPKETKDSKTQSKFCQGELTYSNFSGKSWLLQKLNSHIVPAPSNIKTHEIISEAGKIFVVEVQQSFTPPHQSGDGKYYIRLEEEAKPAPHGIVEALFFRRQKPKLLANFEVIPSKEDPHCHSLIFHLGNHSLVNAERIFYRLEVVGVLRADAKQNIRKTVSGEPKYNFVFQLEHPHIIVKGITVPIEVEVFHAKANYLVSFNYWCSDSKLNFIAAVVDPKENKLIESQNSEEQEEVDLIKLYNFLDPIFK